MAISSSSWIPNVEVFVDLSRTPIEQNASMEAIASLVKKDVLSIEALVKEMELYLITTDHMLRGRGILLLAEVLRCLPSKHLDSATVHTLTVFFTEKLADWQALHGTLIGCLALLRRNKTVGMVTASDARALVHSYLQNIQVQSLGMLDRKLCYEILICLMNDHSEAVATLGDDLIYGICEAIDGEMDPHCLMLTFDVVADLARLFPDPLGPLASFADELFDILGRYFPIHFTHQPNDDADIKRDNLARALMLAFSSTPLFEPFVIPLLLEKLSSSLPTAKVDSLKYLSDCSVKYGADIMAKHAKAIWSSLKATMLTFSPWEPLVPQDLESPDCVALQKNETVKESILCLQKFMLQDDGLFLGLILEDKDLELILSSVTSMQNYGDISVENKQKLCALGCMLSISARASTACCNRVFRTFFPRLMDILGLSTKNSTGSCTSSHSCVLTEELNFGALYLCLELLVACRSLAIGSEELSGGSTSVKETWYCLLKDFSYPLSRALSSILVISRDRDVCESYIYCVVKGLQFLAIFPGSLSPISKSVFEDILSIFVSITTASSAETLLWKLTLKALVEIGTFVEKYHSEKSLSFMTAVVERIVSLICLCDSTASLSLLLEAISDIGAAGQQFMMRVTQGLEEAISANFFEASVKGNMKSVQTTILLLECYSSKVLPWFDKNEDFESTALRFTLNLLSLFESNTSFNSDQGKELHDKTMTTVKLAVAGCSKDNQDLIVQKAYNVLSSSRTFNVSMLSSSLGLDDLSYRDEWLIPLFASVIVALRPQTPIPNIKDVLKFFMIVHLRGHVPAAQALGSVVNKLPLKINSLEVSNAFTLEEATDIIFKTGVYGSGCLIKCPNGNDGDPLSLPLFVGNSKMSLSNAMAGLAWVGKGLVMRGHEKVRDVIMIILRCLLSNSEQNLDSLDMIPTADAFRILLSDSDGCLNKKFHATVRPLYKQHFFSSMMPILLSSIKDSDSLVTRSMLYRAFGHVISNTPLSAVVTDAKRLMYVLLDSISILSQNVEDKDLTYSLLLVLSGIIMDENGREIIIENAHVIIDCLTGLISYSHMMLVRETAMQCLIAMSGLPHTRIYPLRIQVLQAISKALDDTKRTVRHEAVRCRQAWRDISSLIDQVKTDFKQFRQKEKILECVQQGVRTIPQFRFLQVKTDFKQFCQKEKILECVQQGVRTIPQFRSDLKLRRTAFCVCVLLWYIWLMSTNLEFSFCLLGAKMMCGSSKNVHIT